ncbi:nuclear factor 7, ovary-like [Elgaria multicarinata webbii]|uniref:nuclear factor 7, ovary-like n=1 Tax=Elgaria multicarinata webbii TaxID=159646 RepID=UPI002FCCC9E2
MASSLAEDLECAICLAIFQEPHTLSCGHNFCLSCLQGCVPEGRGEGTCPECRLPFELRQLACNRALASVASKVRRLKLDREPLPGTAHYCADHDEPLKLFCRQDRVPICVICRDLPQHRGHEFLPTQNALEYAQGKLKPCLEALEEHLKNTVEDESYQKKEITALEGFTEDNLSYVSGEFMVLHQILNEKEQDIKKTVQEMKDKNWEKMKDALSSLKEEILSDTEIIAKIKAALEATDQVAFLKVSIMSVRNSAGGE